MARGEPVRGDFEGGGEVCEESLTKMVTSGFEGDEVGNVGLEELGKGLVEGAVGGREGEVEGSIERFLKDGLVGNSVC